MWWLPSAPNDQLPQRAQSHQAKAITWSLVIAVVHLLVEVTYCRLKSLEGTGSTDSSIGHWDWWWVRPLPLLFLHSQTHVLHLLETKHYGIAIGSRIILHSELENLNLSGFTCKLVLQLFPQAVNVLYQTNNFRTVKFCVWMMVMTMLLQHFYQKGSLVLEYVMYRRFHVSRSDTFHVFK